ncbi:hypothetical protein ACSMXM_00185 [Pacificimonas sp. ICDLI1SI03]|jgi:ubiquinone biosynthesis protein Coq4|tara:strand:- start:22321 stop:23217 length:897 start_codon:yes stop_codon:yes gene_type:complete
MTDNIASRVSEADVAYFNQGQVHHETQSSVLISSSPYLNDPELRDLIAQEMLRRNGPDLPSTAYIPHVVKCLMKYEDWPRIFQLFEEEKQRLPEFKAWLEGRKVSLFKPEELEDPKAGTLKEVVHDFVVNSPYNMDFFYQGLKIENDFDFYQKERTHSHDIEHMITGFETNHAGEIALLEANEVAVYNYFVPELAAFFNRTGAYLKAKTMMKSGLHYPESYAIEVKARQVGAAQGANWKHPLFLIPFRDMLDRQLSDIREEFGITNPPPPGEWAYTTALSEDERLPDNDVAAHAQAAE